MSVSKTILIGRVGGQPEIKRLDNGNSVANFTLTTDDSYKGKDGNKVEQVDWHRISIWGKLAEVVDKYVNKGDMLYLEGKNKTRSYDKDGNTHYVTEVICNQMTMLGGKKEVSQQQSTKTDYSANGGQEEDLLPF